MKDKFTCSECRKKDTSECPMAKAERTVMGEFSGFKTAFDLFWTPRLPIRQRNAPYTIRRRRTGFHKAGTAAARYSAIRLMGARLENG